MRWDGLFADLEGQLAQAGWQEVEAEAAEMTRGEWAAVTLEDRLRGAIGSTLRLHLSGGEVVELQVATLGTAWVGGSDRSASLVIPLEVVTAIEASLGVARPQESAGGRRLGIGAVYRALSRARAAVSVAGRDGVSVGEGTIDRVGADHFDLTVHPRDEQRRGSSLRGRRVVPFSAVRYMRSALTSSV